MDTIVHVYRTLLAQNVTPKLDLANQILVYMMVYQYLLSVTQYTIYSLLGICIPLNSADFYCDCTEERTGTHCDRLIDYCHNVTCLNKGRCRSVPPSYRCDCLSASYSGLHCEHVVRSIVIRQYVSKSFGYVVIIALCTVLGFIIIMDILKYGFGIDPVHKDREFIRRRRAILERKYRDSQKRSVQTRKY